MKKMLFLTLSLLFVASGLQAYGLEKLLIKNVGTDAAEVFVGPRQTFTYGWAEFTTIKPGETKEFKDGEALILGKYGSSQLYLQKGEHMTTKKPMLGLFTYDPGYLQLKNEYDIDNNGVATIEVDGNRIKR